MWCNPPSIGLTSKSMTASSKSGGAVLFFDFKHRFYDSLSRLIEVDYNNGANVYNYGYDVAGNLVDLDGVSRTFNAANQMVNDGTNTLTYDNNGNLTGNGIDTYTWDRANRLLSVGNHSYVYDGLGNRVQQTVSSLVTDYLNDVQPGLTKLLKQDDGTNVEKFVHAPRGIHAVDDGTDWNFYAQDGLGSVRAVMDANGAVGQNMSYDPYGNPMGSYGAGFGFTGEQTDENGSMFLRARYYEPQLGVFSGSDPFEGKTCTPMTLNGYSWVEGNVPNSTDPSGKSSLTVEVVQGLIDTICDYGPCALTDVGEQDVFGWMPCKEHLDTICDLLCGGEGLAERMEEFFRELGEEGMQHPDKGLLQRWIELDNNIRGFGREETFHRGVYDEIQRQLIEPVQQIDNIPCESQDNVVKRTVNTAREWRNVASPFIVTPEGQQAAGGWTAGQWILGGIVVVGGACVVGATLILLPGPGPDEAAVISGTGYLLQQIFAR